MSTRLWPRHCIQHTPGAALIPALNQQHLDLIVAKGTTPHIETYSGFGAPFRNPRLAHCETELAAELRAARITHVFVVGLAADYCVAATARDALDEGFVTLVVHEGTRPVDGEAWARVRSDLEECGITVVSVAGEEVRRVRRMVE